jgi:hypothetical protein
VVIYEILKNCEEKWPEKKEQRAVRPPFWCDEETELPRLYSMSGPIENWCEKKRERLHCVNTLAVQ